jgi:hypothetical protein
MFRLLAYTDDGHQQMRQFVYQDIRKIGNRLNQTQEKNSSTKSLNDGVDKENKPNGSVDPNQWVSGILTLKDKFENILLEAFDRDKQFEVTVNEVEFQ